jgi:hypothetical protein
MNRAEYITSLRKHQEEMRVAEELLLKKMLAEDEAKKGNFEDLKTLRQWQWLSHLPPKRKFIFNFKEAFDQESGFLPAGKACMIASAGGCGKTFLLTHCALAAATGTEWLNAKAVEPIKVLFVAAEEDEGELWHRFYRMAYALGITQNKDLLDRALDNIIAVPHRGRNQRLIDEHGTPTKSFEDLKEAIDGDPTIKLVILDPAVRFMGDDTETSNSAATEWVTLIDQLTLTGGNPTLLVAHHTNKSAQRPVANDKKQDFDQTMCRGASALVDGFRWVLGLKRFESEDNKKSIQIKLVKSNYSSMGKTLEFELDFEHGGVFKLLGEVSAIKEKQTTGAPIENGTSSRSYDSFSSGGGT